MRESLGTFRLHRWTCDNCSTQVENRTRGNGPIPRPAGWGHVSVSVEEGRPKEGDVCSPKCASEFVHEAANPPQVEEAGAVEEVGS